MNIIDFVCWVFTGKAPTPVEKHLRSAKRGNVNAQHQIGLYHYQGTEAPENPAEAVRWFRLAAQQGHTDAQYHLGRCYHAGKGVKRDLETAYAWLEQAAQTKHREALLWRCLLEQEMAPEQVREGRLMARELA